MLAISESISAEFFVVVKSVSITYGALADVKCYKLRIHP